MHQSPRNLCGKKLQRCHPERTRGPLKEDLVKLCRSLSYTMDPTNDFGEIYLHLPRKSSFRCTKRCQICPEWWLEWSELGIENMAAVNLVWDLGASQAANSCRKIRWKLLFSVNGCVPTLFVLGVTGWNGGPKKFNVWLMFPQTSTSVWRGMPDTHDKCHDLLESKRHSWCANCSMPKNHWVWANCSDQTALGHPQFRNPGIPGLQIPAKNSGFRNAHVICPDWV